MRRPLLVLAGVIVTTGMVCTPSASGAPAHGVRTVAGAGASGSLSAPRGIAEDHAGDLFIADTNHCRVVLVPEHSGTMYGLHVRAHDTYTLTGTTCTGPHALGYPTGVAVDANGDVYVAEATAERVQEIRPGGHTPVTVAGTGTAGYSGDGQPADASALNEPSGVAVDATGNLFIADTANCRIREMPVASGTSLGQPMLAGHLYTVAGNGVCGSAQRSGPATQAQIWNPVALAVDSRNDLFIADNGDQAVLEVPTSSGTFYGTTIAAHGIGAVISPGGDGNGPYFKDGFPSTIETAELNDPEGVAVSPAGTLYVTDGSQHCIRVVPSATTTILGRTMTAGNYYTLAGALTVDNAQGTDDGTQWILTHMGVPVGLTFAPSGALVFSDRSLDQVREIG